MPRPSSYLDMVTRSSACLDTVPQPSAMTCLGKVPQPSKCLDTVLWLRAKTCLGTVPRPSVCLGTVLRPSAYLDTVPQFSVMPRQGAST